MHLHKRLVQFMVRVNFDRNNLALLEFFPQTSLWIGKPDMLLESAHQVLPVLLTSNKATTIYQAGIEEFEKGGKTALVAIMRRGAQK